MGNRWYRLLNRVTETDINEDPDYRKAKKRSEDFKPKKGVSYKWIYDYALLKHQEILESDKIINEKAERIVKIVGPSSGLFAIAISLLINYAQNTHSLGFSLYSIGVMAAALISIAASMVLAMAILKPHPFQTLIDVDSAIRTTEYFWKNNGDDYKEMVWGDWALGIEAGIKANVVTLNKKAKLLRFAHNTYSFAYFLLIGGLVYAVL